MYDEIIQYVYCGSDWETSAMFLSNSITNSYTMSDVELTVDIYTSFRLMRKADGKIT